MKRMWDDSEIVKIVKEQSGELTPDKLENVLEGSDTVVVDLNEEGDKLQVRLDNDVTTKLNKYRHEIRVRLRFDTSSTSTESFPIYIINNKSTAYTASDFATLFTTYWPATYSYVREDSQDVRYLTLTHQYNSTFNIKGFGRKFSDNSIFGVSINNTTPSFSSDTVTAL